MLPIADAARRELRGLELDEAQAADVRVGRNARPPTSGDAGPVALFAPDGTFLALYEQPGRGGPGRGRLRLSARQ